MSKADSKPVISRKNLPSSVPFNWTCVLFLLLDRFSAPGWVWGAVGLLVVLAWIGCLMAIYEEKHVDIITFLKR